MPRPKGFIDWRPQRKTRALLLQIDEILDMYRDHLPLTVRQIFYRLVGSYEYDKTEKSYESLAAMLVKARRARRIPFSVIRDDGFQERHAGGFIGKADFMEAVLQAATGYERDMRHHQSTRLIALVEAAGMLPQIERVAAPYGVPCSSSGGFDSVTAKYAMAKSARDAWNEIGKRTCFLHVGDYDPSGQAIFDCLAADVTAFTQDLGCPGIVDFARVAVTPEQIEAFELPIAPAKKSDRRNNGIKISVQCESLPPDLLAQVVQDAIEERTDMDRYALDQRIEATERAELVEQISTWQEAV